MQISIIIGVILVLAYLPLVLWGSWFLLSLTLKGRREPSYFLSFLSFLAAIFCFVLAFLLIFFVCTAILDGSISCPDGGGRWGGGCRFNSVYSVSENPIEFWSVIAYRYFASIGSGVLAVSLYDFCKKSLPKKP